jgi:DNA repair protein RadA
MLLAEKVLDLLKEGIQIKAVIIDSLTAHFRAEFIGRGTLAERQQKLNKHMHTLLKTAEHANAVVYVTNQVMAKPDTFFGDPTQAIGGHIVAHASTYRIYLRKGRKSSRVAKLIDAPALADGEAAFFVKENHLESIEL